MQDTVSVEGTFLYSSTVFQISHPTNQLPTQSFCISLLFSIEPNKELKKESFCNCLLTEAVLQYNKHLLLIVHFDVSPTYSELPLIWRMTVYVYNPFCILHGKYRNGIQRKRGHIGNIKRWSHKKRKKYYFRCWM